MPAMSAQNARRAMILSRIPPHPRTAPGTEDDHRADYDEGVGFALDRGCYARSARLSGGLSSVRRKTTQGAGSTRPKPRRNPA